MSQKWKCDKCNYIFCDGFNHHVPGQAAFCGDCGALHQVKCSVGYWGFAVGEKCQVIVFGKKSILDKIIVKDGGKRNLWNWYRERLSNKLSEKDINDYIANSGMPEYDNLVIVPLESVKCGKCGKAALHFEMTVGSQCPNCQEGKMAQGGSVVY